MTAGSGNLAEREEDAVDERPTATEAPRLFSGKAWFWLPVVPLVALDLWSKAFVFSWLAEQQPTTPELHRRVDFDLLDWLPGDFGFALVHWENTGTIWGLFQDFTWALMVLRFGALFVLLWLVSRTPSRRWFQLLVLGLIFAGAVGNLYDNVFMENRAVRDFLLFFRVDGLNREQQFPAFNIADSCITVGAFALAIQLLFEREPSKAGGAGGAAG